MKLSMTIIVNCDDDRVDADSFVNNFAAALESPTFAIHLSKALKGQKNGDILMPVTSS